MKVFIGRFGHESNTFATPLTTFEMFKDISQLIEGKDALTVFPGTGDFMGGIVDKGNELGVEMVPTMAGESVSSRLTNECLETAMDIILNDLKACKDEIDGICFCLHGAGCSEGIDDLESYLNIEFINVDSHPTVNGCELYLAGSKVEVLDLAKVETIPAYAFVGVRSISKAIFSSSLTSIGYGSFIGCKNITRLELPEGLTSIQGFAFFNLSNLSEVHLPDSLTNIGPSAFERCSQVERLDVPGSLRSVGKKAFSEMRSLKKINVHDLKGFLGIELEDPGSSFFTNHSDLYINDVLIDKLKIENVEKINDYLFYGLDSVRSIEISDGVTTLGKSSFADMKKLESVTLPDSLESIGESAFAGCDLSEITIPKHVRFILNDAFTGCALRSVHIYESLKLIPKFSTADHMIYVHNTRTDKVSSRWWIGSQMLYSDVFRRNGNKYQIDTSVIDESFRLNRITTEYDRIMTCVNRLCMIDDIDQDTYSLYRGYLEKNMEKALRALIDEDDTTLFIELLKMSDKNEKMMSSLLNYAQSKNKTEFCVYLLDETRPVSSTSRFRL